MSYEYQLRAGTLAWRAMNWLRMFLADNRADEISTSAWAAALQVTTPDLISSMQPVLKAKLVFSRQKSFHVRSPLFWSLVDHGGVDIDAVHRDAEYTEGRDSQQVLKAEGTSPDATGERPATASPSVGSMGAGQPADAGAARVVGFCRHGQPACAACQEKAATPNDAVGQVLRAEGFGAMGAGEPADADEAPTFCPVRFTHAELVQAVAAANAQLLKNISKPKEVAAIQLATVSFTVSLHLVERITQAVAKITEVRS